MNLKGKRVTTPATRKELEPLYRVGFLPKATFYRAIANKAISLGWQKRGGVFSKEEKDLLQKALITMPEGLVKEAVKECLIEKKHSLTIEEVEKLNSWSIGLTVTVLKAKGFSFDRSLAKEVASEALIWALETCPSNLLEAKRTFTSRVPVVFSKYWKKENRKAKLNFSSEKDEQMFFDEKFSNFQEGSSEWDFVPLDELFEEEFKDY